jgi:signal transduction histidine kinase
MVAFATIHTVQLMKIVVGVEWTELDTFAFMLLLPYSLFRWGAGRECAIGLVLFPVAFALIPFSSGVTSVGDAIGAGTVLLFPAVLGASVRFRASSHLRELDQVKLLEREQLARELHDTVAHYISAIAIQAQAGRTLAPTQPQAAVTALNVIEEAAARTLTELRGMVRILRQDEPALLAPQPGLGDIERLADNAGDKLPVDLALSGDLEDLNPSVEAAIYRVAQESITNAVRHARQATRIYVSVVGNDNFVHLTVSDDGVRARFDPGASSGFGLVGMAERAALLGGTFAAGPGADEGWTVETVLPRNGMAG